MKNGFLGSSMTNQSEYVEVMRAQGVDVMASLSVELSRLLDTSTQLSAAMQSLSHVVDKADSAGSLQAVAARIGAVQSLLQQWNQRLGDGSLRGSFCTIDFSLQDLQKIAIRFNVIAMQAHIEMKAESADETSKFIDDLRATPVEISACVDALKDSTRRVHREHNAALKECSRALAEIAEIADIFNVAMTSIHEDRTIVTNTKIDVSTVVDQFLLDMRKHSVSIISSFQFSDFFAQRMAHIAHLLDQSANRSLACSALAKAQIVALVRDGQDTVRSIYTAINQISSIQAEFTAAFGDHEKNVRRMMERQHRALECVMMHRDDALAALSNAFSSTISIFQAVEESQERFQRLHSLSGLIDMAAINARLRSSRMVHAQKTMAVLSTAVLQAAQESREVMTSCAKSLDWIANTHDAGISNNLKVHVDAFRKDYDECSNGMLVAMAELNQLGQLRADVIMSLGQLNDSLAASREVADRLMLILQSLSGISNEIADASTDLVWPDLSDIFDIYTMESERVVHREVLGLPKVTALIPSPQEELDLVFF